MKIITLFLSLTTILTLTPPTLKTPLPKTLDRNLLLANQFMSHQKGGLRTKQTLKTYRRLAKILQNPRKKRRFMKIIKSLKSGKSSKSASKRKLKILGFDFLDEKLPFLQNPMVETLVNGGLLYFGGKAISGKLQGRQISKLKEQVNQKKGDLSMISAQKDRDLRYVQQSMVDLEDHLADLEETMNSNLDDLDHWVDGTVTNLGLI